MKLELLNKLEIKLGDELSEFANSGHDEVSDWAHETADGDESVIYCGKAEELYHAATNSEKENAEANIEDCGGFAENSDMSSRFCQLAYWIVRERLMDAAKEQAEEAEEELREKIDILEEIECNFQNCQ